MTRLLTRVLAALAASAVMAGPVAAEPALWRVEGKGGSTVYLFGTVHVLRRDTAWRSPKIDKAFARSNDLWLEITDDDPGKVQDLLETLGIDRDHPLSTKAPAKDIARLPGVAEALGAKGGEEMFEPMQPWFAALTITLAPIVAAGFDPQSGVDRTLKARATASGKPLKAFETGESQLHFLADLPNTVQVEYLESALDDFDKGPAKLDALVASWRDGDVETLAATELADMKADQPTIYRTLVVDRNRRWAAAIAERLKRPGISFVAVGAAHLAGPDSVQSFLSQAGVTAVRE